MTRLDGSQVLFGLQPIIVTTEFDTGTRTTTTGNAGGSLNYDDNWVGRYYTTEAEILTFNFNPVIAYRVLPWLSLGAGFSVQWAKLKSEAAINHAFDQLPGGRLKYEDTNFRFTVAHRF